MKLLKNGYRSYLAQSAKRLALVTLAGFSGLMLAKPALAADITVASPINGTTDQSPVWVRAHNMGCDGLPPTAFGFTIDNSGTLYKGATVRDIDVVRANIATGIHTIHFKSWTTNGACPTVSSTIHVVASAGSSPSSSDASAASSNATAASSATVSSIPSSARSSGILDGRYWAFEKDAGTPGSGRGSTAYPSFDNAREFHMTYSRHGGVRWHNSFATDASATHFVYDTYVYLTNPSQVANLEMDVNHVMSNGETVILATQCSSYSRTWEFSIRNSRSHWKSSGIPCNPKNWSAKTWHHIQIASHHTTGGTVTYDWVNLDGKHSTFHNATGVGGEHLGWQRGTTLINFQIDGASSGSGSVTAYIHKMTIFRW
jgi:hypothetical protein